MALDTKLYFDSTTAPTLPAGWAFPVANGGCQVWTTYGQAVSRRLAFGTKGASAYSNLAATSAAAEDTMVAQYAGQIAAGTRFVSGGTDTFFMQMLSHYVGPAAVDVCYVGLWVVNALGTAIVASLTGGIVDVSSGTPLNANSKKNHTWATVGTYAVSYTAVGGEWLVIEVGFSASTAVAPVSCTLRVGEGSGSGTDLPSNETQTADGIPWIKNTSGGGDPILGARPDVCVGAGVLGTF